MKKTLHTLSLFALIVGSAVFAEEVEGERPESLTQEEHVSVDSRPLSKEKKEHADLERFLEAQQAAHANEHAFAYVNPSLAPNRFIPVDFFDTLPLHYHSFSLMGEVGDWIGFKDGSRWRLPMSDARKLYSWRLNDNLVVSPNTSWFSSSYNYIITNLSNTTSQNSVYANLFIGPKAFEKYTHWVQALDRDHNQVFLENGSSWQVSSSDSDLFNEWEINDTVIIGVYDVWFSSYDRILINVDMNHYVRAVQF